jgi:hypothetical protein
LESTFPTLKRGANKHCASGAIAGALSVQESISLVLFVAARLPEHFEDCANGIALRSGAY